jgi:hypothetical protein
LFIIAAVLWSGQKRTLQRPGVLVAGAIAALIVIAANFVGPYTLALFDPADATPYRFMKVPLAIGLVIAIVLLALKLATAPLFAVYDASDCQAAYARAHTLADSARVDLHPYKASARAGKRRCGEVRARRVITAADIPTLPR